MKITYLAYKEQADGRKALTVITVAEWRQITADNKTRSIQDRRYFVSDVIVEGKERDILVYEVSRSEHRKISNAKKEEKKKRDAKKVYVFYSLDDCRKNDVNFGRDVGYENAFPALPFEDQVLEKVDLDLLRKALAAWKPWANDMLDCYLAGNKIHCTVSLSHKYGVKERMIRKYKKQFEEFVKKFFS